MAVRKATAGWKGRGAAMSSLPLALAACAPGILDPAGPVAAGERTILFNSLAIMMLIVIPTIIATLVFAWWFRAGNDRAIYRPTWSYSGRIELLVWSVPALIVIFLAGLTWVGTHQLAPERPLASKVRPITVQVVALDWKWLFLYPDQGIATVNRLVIPVGTPVAFRITSGTVMNSFFVPQLGSQIYAMAGMDARLHLQADRPGRYRGLSAHYSGEGFADMAFMVDAVSPAQFVGWTARTRAAGPVLDDRHFMALSRPGSATPHSYRAIPPALYDRIIANHGTSVHEDAKSGREDNHVR